MISRSCRAPRGKMDRFTGLLPDFFQLHLLAKPIQGALDSFLVSYSALPPGYYLAGQGKVRPAIGRVVDRDGLVNDRPATKKIRDVLRDIDNGNLAVIADIERPGILDIVE